MVVESRGINPNSAERSLSIRHLVLAGTTSNQKIRVAELRCDVPRLFSSPLQEAGPVGKVEVYNAVSLPFDGLCVRDRRKQGSSVCSISRPWVGSLIDEMPEKVDEKIESLIAKAGVLRQTPFR